MGDAQTPEPAGPAPGKLELPSWAWLVVGLLLLAVAWWLLADEEGSVTATSPTTAPTPAASTPSTPSETDSTPAPQIEVAAQAELLENQGKIEALLCEFELIGAQGMSGKKLLDGSLAYELDLNVRDDADPINRFDGLHFGDETTDGQVSPGTAEEDRIVIFQTVEEGQRGPFFCELEALTVEGSAVELTGVTEVEAK